jgi:predicted methyltransferase
MRVPDQSIGVAMACPSATQVRSAKCPLPVTAVALIALLVTAAAPAPTPRPDFEHFRARMEDPARAQWQRPAEVVNALGLRRGQRVADIGAGTGYFTSLLAEAVGRSGRVYAVDLDTAAVQYMRQRFQREKLPQVSVVQSTASDPHLPGRVDLIFIRPTDWYGPDSVAGSRMRDGRHLSE